MLFVSTGDHIIPDELGKSEVLFQTLPNVRARALFVRPRIHCILHDESGVVRNEIENVSTDCINKVMKTAATLMESHH